MTRTRYGDTMAQPRTLRAFTFRIKLGRLRAALYPRYMSVTQVSQKKTILDKSNRRQNWNTQTQALTSFEEHGLPSFRR